MDKYEPGWLKCTGCGTQYNPEEESSPYKVIKEGAPCPEGWIRWCSGILVRNPAEEVDAE